MMAPPSRAAVIATFGLLAGLSAPAAGGVQEHTLDDLAFLVGCWQGTLADGTVIREQYSPPRGGLVLGSSHFTDGAETRFFEFSKIQQTGSQILYTPLPEGRDSVSFTLVEITREADAVEAVFENAEHDFPQRIAYRRQADGSLRATVEGPRGGESVSESYLLQPAPCDG